jgi:hypothetical protein
VEEERIPAVLLNAGSLTKNSDQWDFRWVNRGAYRLLTKFGVSNQGQEKRYGCFDLPEARSLYGPLDKQRMQENSFFCQLKRIIAIRSALEIPTGIFHGLLDTLGEDVLGLLTWIGSTHDREAALVVLNFSSPAEADTTRNLNVRTALNKKWPAEFSGDFQLLDAFNESQTSDISDHLRLDPWQFKLLHLRLPTSAAR